MCAFLDVFEASEQCVALVQHEVCFGEGAVREDIIAGVFVGAVIGFATLEEEWIAVLCDGYGIEAQHGAQRETASCIPNQMAADIPTQMAGKDVYTGGYVDAEASCADVNYASITIAVPDTVVAYLTRMSHKQISMSRRQNAL